MDLKFLETYFVYMKYNKVDIKIETNFFIKFQH